MVLHTVGSYVKSYSPSKNELEKQTVNFAALANFLALKGGALKKEQYLSGLVADYFSNLYLAHSVRWYQKQFKVSQPLTEYCIDRLLSENKKTLGKILQNERSLAVLFWHLHTKNQYVSFTRQKEILREVETNPCILEHIKEDLYLQDNILGDLEKLDEYQEGEPEYQKIYDRVINVGEYDNINLRSRK
jgi:hypothetical protein